MVGTYETRVLRATLLRVGVPNDLSCSYQYQATRPALVVRLVVILAGRKEASFVSIYRMRAYLGEGVALREKARPNNVLRDGVIGASILCQAICHSFRPCRHFSTKGCNFTCLLSFPEVVVCFATFGIIVPLTKFVRRFRNVNRVRDQIIAVLNRREAQPQIFRLSTTFEVVRARNNAISLCFSQLSARVYRAPRFVGSRFNVSNLLCFLCDDNECPRCFILKIIISSTMRLFGIYRVPYAGDLLSVSPRLPRVRQAPIGREGVNCPRLSLLLPIPSFRPAVRGNVSVQDSSNE